jgi:hypothetical protein
MDKGERERIIKGAGQGEAAIGHSAAGILQAIIR